MVGEITNKRSQGAAEYLLILAAVLVVAAIAVYYVSRGPAFPTISPKAATDSTKDNIVIEVYSGSIAANEWEYRLSKTSGSGTWRTGATALSVGTVNIDNIVANYADYGETSAAGTWYVSLRHKASGHEYITNQAVTVE